MNRYYSDLFKLASEAGWGRGTSTGPQAIWFDENAVPRFCEFSTEHLDIYWTEACLLLIACQSCGQEFKVAMSQDNMAAGLNGKEFIPAASLASRIKNGSIHYGDPPNIQCCPAGPTMNCMDLKVLQFWVTGSHKNGWTPIRFPELEILLPDHPDWVRQEDSNV